MSKRVLQSALVAAACVLLPVASARASSTTVCTTGSLSACVEFTFTLTGTNTYTLEVDFLSSSDGGSLYQFGVNSNNSTIGPATSIQVDGGFNPNWGSGCNGLPGNPACAQGPTGGGGLAVGDYAIFTFTAIPPVGALPNFDGQVHIQAFNTLTCSAKLGTGASDFGTAGKDGIGSFNLGDEGEDCGGTPTTSTPEPASLWLVGSGLIGVAGAGIRRRRRG